MLLFAVTEDIEHSVELAKLPELLRQEDLTILLVPELSPDLWHEHPDTDSEFLSPCGKDRHIFKEFIVTPRNSIS